MTGYVETCRGVVGPAHCDHQGHMNTAQYLVMFDQACWQLMSRSGVARSRMEADRSGLADVRVEMDYAAELRVGDPFVIESAIVKLGTTSIGYHSVMFHADTGERVCEAYAVSVFFDLDAREKRPIPDDLRARLEAVRVERRA